MDYFQKIADSKVVKGGNLIKDGSYRYLIERCVYNAEAYDGATFVAELRVIKSVKTIADVEPNAVGSTVSMVCNLAKHPSAPGNVKTFILAALGSAEGDIPGPQFREIVREACSPEQPLRGLEIENNTYRRKNQGRSNPANAGKDMTLNGWVHVPGQTDNGNARLKANRAILDGSAPMPAAAPPAPAPAPVTSLLGSLK